MEDKTYPEHSEVSEPAPRRVLLTNAARGAMLGGLVAGYGTFGAFAGRYLLSSQSDRQWLFVSDVQGIRPGESRDFTSPTGVKVTIKRASESDARQAATVEQFAALSSVCPHLGCRVHWESQNQRFFCPCHNGEFDPDGRPTGGPVLAAGQHLSRYPLRIEGGLLFIEMSLSTVRTPERGES
jgi:nitrite reductase/ring-hydroxylating ferredoxin subunit